MTVPGQIERRDAAWAAQQLLDRRKARRGLLDFLRFVWWEAEPLLIGRHTMEMCARIDAAVSRLRAGVSSFLDIRVPFRHGKSQISSRALPAYALGALADLDPDIIIAGHSAALSEGFSRVAQNIVRSARYQALFPGVLPESGRSSVSEWSVAGRNGVVFAVGMGGGAAGRGGKVIIIDDYIANREQAESETWREKMWSAFKSDLMSRRAPASLVLVVATPWHVDGIQGRIEREEQTNPDFPRFDRVRFAAREVDETAQDGWRYLFPERFPAEWYKSQYGTLTPYEAAGLLDCDPKLAAGNMAKREWFGIVPASPANAKRGRWWDTAATKKKKSDFTAGALGSMSDGVFYCEGLWHDRANAGEVPGIIKTVAQQDVATYGRGCQVWLEREPGSQGPIAVAMMIRLLAGFDVHVSLNAAIGQTKVVRAMPFFSAARAGNVKLVAGPWIDKFLREIDTFPNGVHDDTIDPFAGLYSAFTGSGVEASVSGPMATCVY